MNGWTKFYVATRKLRDQPRTWTVADRSGYRLVFVSKPFVTRKSAEKLCERMNADWERYLQVPKMGDRTDRSTRSAVA